MFSQHSIRLIFLCLLLQSANSYGQSFPTDKYNREYSPYFKFNQFKRGEKSKVLSEKLDRLAAVNKLDWTFEDSLEFAEIALITGKVDLSRHYLSNLLISHNNNKLIKLSVVACYLKKDYTHGKLILNEHISNPLINSPNYFLKRIFLSFDSLSTNLNLNHQVLGLWKNDSIPYKKGSSRYLKEIITPLINARETMAFYVLFIHEDNPVIARCFNEMGKVLELYVSLNQAYISYSIARIYNRKDAEILINVKRIKGRHIQKNYNTPNFRKYFPRVEYWRLESDLLNEEFAKKGDSIPKFVPNLVGKSKDKVTSFPIDIIFPTGILLIIFLFILLTRRRQ